MPVLAAAKVSSATANLALVMSAVCVRNTIIEDNHAAGKISDAEMEAFNRQVADRVFTFLKHLFGSQRDHDDFMKMVSACHPHGWDRPKLDHGMVGALEKFRERTKGSRMLSDRI